MTSARSTSLGSKLLKRYLASFSKATDVGDLTSVLHRQVFFQMQSSIIYEGGIKLSNSTEVGSEQKDSAYTSCVLSVVGLYILNTGTFSYQPSFT
jgi:hypothetical protein